MAKEVVKNASLLIDSLQLASLANAIEFTAEGEKKVVTNFASGGWEESLLGIRSHNLSAQIFLENIAEPDTTLHSIWNTPTSVPFSVTKTYPPAAGDVCYFTEVVPLTVMRKYQVGEVFGGSISFGPQAAAVRGRILEYNAARSTTGNSAAMQLAATAATERLYIAVHVLAVTGTLPTLDILLESDTVGFPSATTRITVPQITAAGSYFTSVAGPITDTYFRVNATVGGTLPSFTYVVAIGIAPTS